MRIAEHPDLGRAAWINATVAPGEQGEVLQRLRDGGLEYLFLAPEQLARREVADALLGAGVSLVAIDEAHCVDSWGHDFRPDYGRLGTWIDSLGHPPVVALTATAAPPVRRAIVERLALRDAEIVVSGFERPELWLEVHAFHDADEKRDACIAATREAATEGAGLVYASTRARVEELARDLEAAGVRAAAYHAGLGKRRRQAVHAGFRSGEIDLVVATSAFGMGIDRSDVRFVHHLDAPGSLDEYYQEVGRGGRDGARADGRLFFAVQDLKLQRFFAARRVGDDVIERVVRALHELPGRSRAALAEAAGVSAPKVAKVANLLEGCEVLAPGTTRLRTSPAEARSRAVAADEAQLQLQRTRVEMMRAYGETRKCRTRFILSYLGQRIIDDCGHCDRCGSGAGAERPAEPGSLDLRRVRHVSFGVGDLLDADEHRFLVLFDEHGYRTLDRGLVEQHGLLEELGAAG
jgi:ATP-dependent DNA helicase RecQ